MDKSQRFQGQQARQYDQRIHTIIPNYQSIQLYATQALQGLPENAHLLIIGVGTGNDIISLAKNHPARCFTALDPSAAMLEEAQAKTAHLPNKIIWHCGTINTLAKDKLYHAATCLLVMHFIHGNAHKAALLQQIAQRVIPQAPLLLADLMQQTPPEQAALLRHALATGLPESQQTAFKKRLQTEFHRLSPKQLKRLTKQTGWIKPQRRLQQWGIQLWQFAREGEGFD